MFCSEKNDNECKHSKHSNISAHLARLNICGWLANALQFQEMERVNIFDRYAREHHSLSELSSTQTFYLGPKRHNSSKCYLTLAEFA